MKKFILRLDLHDGKDKRKALKTVAALQGIDEISVDINGKKLTIIGTVDPVSVVSKLRKFWPTDIILVGPAKEPEKKEEPKKEEPKKEEAKKEEAKEEPNKEEAKKEEPNKEEPKKEEEKKAEPQPEPVQVQLPVPAVGTVMPYRPYYPPTGTMPYRPYYPPTGTAMPYQPYYPPTGTAMPYRPYYPPMQSYYYANHSMDENPNACVIC